MIPRSGRIVRAVCVSAGWIGIASLSACDRQPVGEDSGAGLHDQVSSLASAVQEEPGEAEQWRLARAIPGFAGLGVDGEGSVLILTTDGSLRGADRALVAGSLPAHLQGRQVVVGRARYTFAELAGWRDQLVEPLAEVSGVTYLDLDETINRVVIGAAGSGATRGAVAALASRLGIPPGAIELAASEEEIAPAPPSEALPSAAPATGVRVTDYVRPLRGGLAIGRQSSATQYYKCTLGFVADLGAVRVLLTNSHCSERSWDNDASIFHQPWPSGTNYRIGTEYRDRRGDSCGFLSLNVCRYSDATAVAIDPLVTSTRGTLARTRYVGASTGSLEIDPYNPPFVVSGKASSIYKGETLDKLGATTGWTRGAVTRTCVVTYQGGRTWSKLRCQYFVQAGVYDGDSGSPVFRDNGNGTAHLYGMLWGRKTNSCDPLSGSCDLTVEYVFSPLSGIEQDLGTLQVDQGTVQQPGSGCSGGDLTGEIPIVC